MSISDFKYRDEEENRIFFYKDRHDILEHKKIWIIAEIVLYLIILILVEKLVIAYCFQGSSVVGSSMLPTLEEDDTVLINKLVYKFKDPKRFDIVVCVMDKEQEINYVKRVIGLPGETVQIKDGKVYIDGKVLEGDTYCDVLIANPGIAKDPITLGEDEYFVLGDNRDVSVDSRKESTGLVNRNQIVGKAILRMRPFSKFGFLK